MGELDKSIGGEVSLPTASPVDAANEDAVIGAVDDEELTHHEPFGDDETAQTYFDNVDNDTTLNYIMFMHDIHAITFDRLQELQTLLSNTTSFLPKES